MNNKLILKELKRANETFAEFDEDQDMNLVNLQLVEDFYIDDIDYTTVFAYDRQFVVCQDVESCIKNLNKITGFLYSNVIRSINEIRKIDATAVYNHYQFEIKPKVIKQLNTISNPNDLIILELDNRFTSDWFEFEERGSEFITICEGAHLTEALNTLVAWFYEK
jgi:hypothetical protein